MPYRFQLFLEDLTHLVNSGEIPISRINDAVERILRVKFVSGLFEHPTSDGSLLDSVNCEVTLTIFCAFTCPVLIYSDVIKVGNSSLMDSVQVDFASSHTFEVESCFRIMFF